MNCCYCDEKIQGSYISVQGQAYCKECISNMMISEIIDEFDVDKGDLLDAIGAYEYDSDGDRADYEYESARDEALCSKMESSITR